MIICNYVYIYIYISLDPTTMVGYPIPFVAKNTPNPSAGSMPIVGAVIRAFWLFDC